MVIHDLRNPVLSMQNGIDIAKTKFNNIETLKSYSSDMTSLIDEMF